MNRRNFLSRTSLGLLSLNFGWSKVFAASSFVDFDSVSSVEKSMYPALEAIFPVALGLQFKDANERKTFFNATLAEVEQIITQLDAEDRKNLLKLFWALNFPPTKLYLTGFWYPWEQIAAADIKNLLENWKNSQSEEKRNAFVALTQLPALGWYVSKESGPTIGYKVHNYNG